MCILDGTHLCPHPTTKVPPDQLSALEVTGKPSSTAEADILSFIDPRWLQCLCCWFFRNAGLDLDSGDHRVISSMVLEAADLDTAPDQVFYFISAAPRFGKLLLKTESSWNELSAGQNFTQEQVEQNRLWYHHRASNTGFRGHDSFRFILSDMDSESLTQSFLISIRTVDRGEIVLHTKAVHLREGERVVLITDILLALDSAGRPEELVFTVSTPPRHGLIHAIQRPGVPLISFTQLDVAAHRVCYTHNNDHDSETDSFR
ncbi:hypothetical protein ATANTOWER_005302 [Ataeniobius toweri]|uniref:Uncharacterized protein n=1 Tax=Ataeniobius toweri TaxID=208326 RepID=A0ABU7CF96_9TELE|nr:hypothetical protein [Ataeniobius toweri]